MANNSEYIRTAAGRLKIILILLLATVLALIAVGFFNSKYTLHKDDVRPQIGDKRTNAIWGEIYLLATATIILCCSVVNILLHVASREIYWNRRTAIIDFFYHCAAFVLLSTSGMLAIVSAVRIFGLNCTTENKCQLFEVKFAAGMMSLLTSLFCGIIAAVVLTNRKDVERDGLIVD